jgi:predicted nucleotidyltransferase component of viral defense system
MDVKKYIQTEQKRIHRLVTERFPDYYLTGGTALAFHFHHRFSEDLDFFTQRYSKVKADEIMKFVTKKTDYSFQLVFEQDSPKLLPIKMYTLAIGHGLTLKVDIVQDPYRNIQDTKNGMHSIEDIFYRKVFIALNPRHAGVDDTGREMTTSRREAKDIFDIYYLSEHYQPLEEFFPKHFSIKLFPRLDAWYRSLDRREMMIDLSERVEGVDPRAIFRHLDDQMIRGLGKKSIEGVMES